MIDLNAYAHSHDSVEVVRVDQVSCVRKIFRSDIARSIRNVAKQKAFKPLYTSSGRVAAAEVLEFSVHSDRAELLMPYVAGTTGHMFPVYGSRNIAYALSDSLSALLYSQLKESHEEFVETSLFVDKLQHVADATKDVSLRKNDCAGCSYY
jgi:hypothetical protein